MKVWPADGERGAGLRRAGAACRCSRGAGVVPGGGAGQDRQDGQPLAGAGVHPGLAPPVFLAGVDVGLGDRAGHGPLRPAGRDPRPPSRPGPGRRRGPRAGCAGRSAAATEAACCPARAPWSWCAAAASTRWRPRAAGSGCRCRDDGAPGRPRSYGRAAGPGCPGCCGPERAGVLAGNPPAGRGPGGRTAGSGRSARPGLRCPMVCSWASETGACGPKTPAWCSSRHDTAL